MSSNPAKLRRLLQEEDILLAPGAYDALSAKIIEQVGFKTAIMGGYSIAASRLAQPDFGALTLTEMAAALKVITDAISIPIIADGDTGYGNPLSVRRTVHEYEKMGAAAIIFEDQVFPKRCGHMFGKEVIPAEQHIQKIKAACEARQNPDLIIVARTDARASLGLKQAIERGKRYLEAGAEVLFIEAPQSEAELAAIGQAFPHTPLVANMVEGGRTPCLSAEALRQLGFKIVFWPCTALYTLASALQKVFASLLETGSTSCCQAEMLTFNQFNHLVGLDEYLDLDNIYKS
ncbi:MAG: isocitrate lyase/PEP mutase family protein [Syntrophomonadaceae bacterium]|jgi:2-methylisocitrate lyase-like PEP mutase family enzyme